jgi:formamidopyrimidine-DNA glycosylase
MPELPEVEVTRLSFANRIAGASIASIHLGKPLRWPLGCDPGSLQGLKVLDVRRRGKYLLIDLSKGLLLVHLGMSGSLNFGGPFALPGKHDHFDMVTDRGTLRLTDPRRFGAVVFASSEADAVACKLLGGLGVEPLGEEFTADSFYKALQLRHTAIKQVLLGGQTVVGVGNIYASEVLFLARIRPTIRASSLSASRVARLHSAIRQVLTQAVQQGGSTLRDFKNAHGEAGNFQLAAQVYDRAGQPCQVCTSLVRSVRQGQRSTFYCAVCQKR